MGAKAPAGQGYPTLEQIRANPIVGRRGQKPLTELALDLSSSCVGWAVGAERKLHRYGKFVFKSTAGTGEKLHAFDDYLAGLITAFWPQALLIEQPMSFRAETTKRHNELVGIVRKVWFERTGREIPKEWLIAPITIKKAMGVPRGGNHDENKKIMLTKVNALYSLNLQWDKNSKINTDDDVADAIAVLTTHYRRTAGATP